MAAAADHLAEYWAQACRQVERLDGPGGPDDPGAACLASSSLLLELVKANYCNKQSQHDHRLSGHRRS